MSRKVFISILGAGYYYPTRYYFDKIQGNEEKVNFVQETLVKKLCNDWSSDGRILIFLTNIARSVNWIDPVHSNDKQKKGTYKGLNSVLKNLKPAAAIKDIDIEDGNTEKEIWEIFNKIFESLQDNDEVYFDVTHAYRSLPIFLMVLINYSKFLKNIEVKKITYGNYEARKGEYSPVLDLTTFSQLQDWTSAVHEYTYSGASESLKKMIKTNARELKGSLKQPLERFANSLSNFNNSILTLRGNEIYKGKNAAKLKEDLKKIKEKNKIHALDPVIDKINQKIKDFNENEDLENGEKAVEWCIEHNLWQQAITLGQEHIISILCKIYGKDYKTKINREFISKSIGVINIERKYKKEKNKSELDKVLEKNFEEFNKLKSDNIILTIINDFVSLSKYRNTYNHAGIVGNIKSADIIKNFKKHYYNIIQKLKKCS